MKKSIYAVVLAIFMILAGLSWGSTPAANADVFTDLGFSTSGEDLQNYEERSEKHPYGSRTVEINSIPESYMLHVITQQVSEQGTIKDKTYLQRSVYGDNNGVSDENLRDQYYSAKTEADVLYVQTVAVDAVDAGKKHAVVEMYYVEETGLEEGANHLHTTSSLYLSLLDVATQFNDFPDFSGGSEGLPVIPIFSETYQWPGNTKNALITTYADQHSYMTMVAGDFDNDGYSELAVYIPQSGHPHIALYQIQDGIIINDPQIYVLGDDAVPSTFLSMKAGDLTGDNIDDLIVSCRGEVLVFKGQDGGFSLAQPQAVQYGGEIENVAVAIGDLFDNGHRQLVIGGFTEAEESGFPPESGSSEPYARYWYSAYNGETFENVLGEGFSIPSPGQYNYSQLPVLECGRLSAGEPGDYPIGYESIGGDWIFFDGYVWKPVGGAGYGEPGDCYLNSRGFGKITGVVAGNFIGHAKGQETFRVLVDTGNYNYHNEWVSSRIHSYSLALAPGNLLNTDGLTNSGTVVYGNFNSDDYYGRDTSCAAMATPNMDEDTIIIKYLGHDLQYSYPTILAALASPPYFEDLAHLDGGDSYIGCSATEITSGEGSSSEVHGNVTVTAGAYISLQQEINIIFNWSQVEASQELTASYAWDYSREKEVSTAITYGTFGGQDSVAVYTIPMDVYKYQIWVPGKEGASGSWQPMNHCFPYPVAYVVISADKYNHIASREHGLPRIGGELFTHTLGQPETYPGSSEEMFNVQDLVEYDLFTTVGYGDAYTAQSIEISESETNSHTFSASLAWRAGGGVAGATAGFIFEIGGGGGWATTTINNVGYTGTILNMPGEAEDYGYSYAYKLAAYPYESVSQNFPVVYYAVQEVRRPPLLPQNFEMQNSTENSITLSWENVDPNVSGFQLYRYYDFEGDLAGYYKVGDVLPVGTTTYTDTDLQPYTHYTYRIQSVGKPYGWGQTASVLGPALTARTNPVSDAPVIVQQPESVEVAAGSTAVFQVIAQPAPNASVADRIFYRWQRYVDGKWQLVQDASDSLWSITGVKEGDAGRYRCAVSQYVGSAPITVYSNPVNLKVDKNNLEVKLSLDPVIDHGDMGTQLALKAELNNADMVISPTGKVNFLITYYAEPLEGENEGDPFSYREPVFTTEEVPLIGNKLAQVPNWTPAGYGSYDITAVYLGDDNYHKSISATRGFTCADSSSASAVGLRITGIENNTLTYGDEVILGASVFRNGQVDSLLADEVEFTVSDPEGLLVSKSSGSSPKWLLTAQKAGSYTLVARNTGVPSLQVSKNIEVYPAQISLAVKEQVIYQGNPPQPFELELSAGEMKLDDSLNSSFQVEYECTADENSLPGNYNIFVTGISGASLGNYEILEMENGRVIVEGPKYNVKFHGVSNGKVTALVNGWNMKDENFSTGYDIAQGASIRFNAIPDPGYRVEKWVINGFTKMKEGSESEYDTSLYSTIASLGAHITAEVFFVPDLCEISFSSGDNGTLQGRVGNVEIGSGAVLPSQTVVSFQAQPDQGYMVKEWKVNNAPVSDNSSPTYYHTVTQNTDIKVFFTPAEYVALNYSAVGNGQVAAENPDGSALDNGCLLLKGSEVIFTAVPQDDNSMIKEWIVNGQVVQGNSRVYTARNIQEALEVQVVFIDAITYKVEFGAIGYGEGVLSAQVDGVEIKSGDQVKGYSDINFTAYPPEGCRVKQWKLGSTVIQDEQGLPLSSTSYTLEELKASVTVTVAFESTDTYQVDYRVAETAEGENGDLKARMIYSGASSDYSSGDDIIAGSKLVLTAIPDAGYTVSAWTVDGTAITGTDAVYTIESVQANYEITVEFAPGDNPLSFAAVGNGSVNAETGDGDIISGTPVADGTQVTFTAIPESGFQVREWRLNGEWAEDNSNSYTLIANNGGYVEVEFEREYYTLILGENLLASVEGYDLQGSSVQGDKTVTVTAVPPAGYLLHAWYRDGALIDGEQGDSYTLVMEQDTEITAQFQLQYYSLTFTADSHGSIKATADGSQISSGTDQPGGCELIFQAQPEEGFRVKAWYRGLEQVRGEKINGGMDETYTIPALSQPEYIRVYFEEIPDEPLEYLVSFSAGNGGNISAKADGQVISSGAWVPAGSRVVFTAQPDSGKIVQAWSGVVNGTLADNKLTFIIDSLASDEEVLVSFTNSGSSTPAGGGGGSALAPSPAVSSSGEASVTPSAGGVISLGSEAAINIPASALQGNSRVTVKITKTDTAPIQPSGFMLLGQVYEMTVGGQSSYTFNKPVTLTFSFDPLQLPAGVSPSVYYYDAAESRWVELPGTVSGNTISVTVDHFTVFALMAMLENPAAPEGKKTELNDISHHWAREQIEKLVAQGSVSGYPDGSFRPEQSITRAEFAAILVKALNLKNAGNNGKVFSDTAGHWAEDSIAAAQSWGIVSGYDQEHFGPEDNITREQMAVMASKALQIGQVSGPTSFKDDAQISSWAQSSVTAAVNNGIISGYPDNSFQPQGNATRAQAVTVIANMLK
jgi:hypothetical protein